MSAGGGPCPKEHFRAPQLPRAAPYSLWHLGPAPRIPVGSLGLPGMRVQSCPPQPREMTRVTGPGTSRLPAGLLSGSRAQRGLWEPEVTTLKCFFPWLVAWDCPWGEPPAPGEALTKTQSQGEPGRAPGCPSGWSCKEIPTPRDLSGGCPAAPVALKSRGDGRTRGSSSTHKRAGGSQARGRGLQASSVPLGWHGTCSDPHWDLRAGMGIKLPSENTGGLGGKARGWKL